MKTPTLAEVKEQSDRLPVTALIQLRAHIDTKIKLAVWENMEAEKGGRK